MAHRGRKLADAALIGGLAGGLTIAEAAQKAKVSVRTAHRRLQDADFRQRVQEARTAMLDRTVGWLAQMSTVAVQELAKVALRAESESAKVSACRALLEHMIRAKELLELEQRLVEVERRLNAKDTPHGKLAPSPGAGRGRNGSR